MSMEEKRERDLPEEQTSPVDTPEDEISEEEKREILSVFSETNENRRKRSGFRLTVRNQLILVGSVLALAAVLLGVYFVALRQEDPLPAFYALDERTEQVLDGLDERVDVRFCNRSEKELTEESDPDVYRIYTYASLYADRTGKVRLDCDDRDTFNGVRLTCGGQTKEIPYADFYLSRASDGKTWGFDGESLFTNAILSLTGGESLELVVRPLDGFDAYGCDVLASGGVVMFPMVERANIELLRMENQTGMYTIYQNNGEFYFNGCEQLTYNANLFASLLVDCRYVVTAGAVEQALDYAVYGLDDEEGLTCSFLLMTLPDGNGDRLFHQVWIGNKDSAGAYYYARYFGGRMSADDTVTDSFSSPRVFRIQAANVDGVLNAPVETFFDANLVGGISKTEDVYSFDQVRLEHFYYDEERPDFSALILNLPVIGFSDNITSNDSSAAELFGTRNRTRRPG